ncbi:hypothetical protein OIDMADRAFT_98373, partial [Oidiodendron maius Zn]
YEALSYVWGSLKNPKNAIMSDGSSISITNNLDIALRHLRYTTEDRQLWVDSLCINQEDIKEKNSQIPLMGSIYRLANRVLAWLGPEENDSGHALQIIDHVGRQELYCICSLFERPWFERIWIRQEIGLSTRALV